MVILRSLIFAFACLVVLGWLLVSSGTAALTAHAQNRIVRAASVTAMPGEVIQVPITIEAHGDEVGVQFSIGYDTTLLSSPQAEAGSDAVNNQFFNTNMTQTAQGRLGVFVLLRNALAQGSRQIAVVRFQVAQNSAGRTSAIVFGNEPIRQRVVDASANVLAASYVFGAVTVAQAFEADTAPRPGGNGLVTTADWVQVGRFVARLDEAAGGEFQRADCAPRETLGDGRLTTTDWVQAGRYAVTADPPVPAGGPTAPIGSLTEELTLLAAADHAQQTRNVRIVAAAIERGQNGSVIIEFDAQGNENAFGFSLVFDPAQLRFLSAAPGRDATGAMLNINTSQVANGRIGAVLALPTGQSFAVAARQILAVNFAATANGNTTPTTLGFGDQPIAREVVSVTAGMLPANFTGGAVTLTRTASSVSAASFLGTNLAAETITAAFGANLATSVEIASGLSLPTQLAGTSIRIRDSAGVERLAPLFFVSPSQINFLMPPGLAAGNATLTFRSGDGTVSDGRTTISGVAPGLFSANASGQGVAAATVLRVKANGSLSYEAVSNFDSALNRAVPMPIDLGNEAEQVFLILFGSGFRHRSALAAVTARIGGEPAEVLYAGPQGEFAGLDQINLRLPRSLAGRGEVTINLVVDGKAANSVTVAVK